MLTIFPYLIPELLVVLIKSRVFLGFIIKKIFSYPYHKIRKWLNILVKLSCVYVYVCVFGGCIDSTRNFTKVALY